MCVLILKNGARDIGICDITCSQRAAESIGAQVSRSLSMWQMSVWRGIRLRLRGVPGGRPEFGRGKLVDVYVPPVDTVSQNS